MRYERLTPPSNNSDVVTSDLLDRLDRLDRLN